MRELNEILVFADRQEWRVWLETHYADRNEAWLRHTKKGAMRPGLSYEEAVEEALCFGWIDGLLRSLDAETFTLRYSPRKRGSVWSESNKQRVEKLMKEGRMSEAGLAKVAEAKENGQWEAASLREQVDVIPPDLEQALGGHPSALEEAYLALPASKRKQWLYWIGSAKRPETRARRVQEIARQVAESFRVD